MLKLFFFWKYFFTCPEKGKIGKKRGNSKKMEKAVGLFVNGGDGLVVILGCIFVTLVDLEPRFAQYLGFSSGFLSVHYIMGITTLEVVLSPTFKSLCVWAINLSNASQHLIDLIDLSNNKHELCTI